MKVTTNDITKAAGLFSIIAGCFVLAGWFFNIPLFKSVLPGIISMKFNTAVCFILSGIVLYLLNAPAVSRNQKTIAIVCSWIVLLAGLLNLSEYIFSRNIGIDELLWKEGPGTAATIFPGRMSLTTSVNFMLLGFIFLNLNKRKYHWFIQALLIAMIPGSLLTIFNYYFGLSFLNNVPLLATTALHTAILFIVVCVGVFFSLPFQYIRVSFKQKIAFVFALVSIILGIIFWAFKDNKKQIAETTQWVEDTREVLFMTEQTNTIASEIQNGARGYFITGNENFLPLFINKSDTIERTIRLLRTLTKNNAGQQLRIDTLQKLIDSYIASHRELVNIRRKEGFDAAQKFFLNSRGYLIIDQVHSMVKAITEEENQLLIKRKAKNEQSIQNSSRIVTFLEVIIVLLLLSAFITIYNNTRQRNKAEAALQQTLMERPDYKYALDEASIVAITDKKGVINHANDNFCKISKYKREELIGQDHRIINSGYHPKEFFRNMWTTIANGKIWRGELKNKAKDGSMYWVDTTIVPFLNEQGKPYQYLSIRNDITERKKAEKSLFDSQQRYKNLLENMNDGFIVDDISGKITFANKNFLDIYNFTENEMNNLVIEDYVAPEYVEILRDRHNRRIAGEKVPDVFEFEGMKKDGKRVWLEAHVNPIIENGNFTGTQSILRDITERKSDEEKLKRFAAELQTSNTELERFAYIASHDLQEPLRMVSSFVNLLEEELNGQLNETSRQYIQFVLDGSSRMKTLINDLLLYSRVGSKKEEFTAIDLNDVMRYVNLVLKADIEKNGVVITINPLPVILAHKSLISQLFVNLVSNAIKYRSDKEPLIEVGYTEEQDKYIFYVKDNGIGIDPKYSDKIFIIFQRLHNKDEYSGTGIGLAICKKITEIHNGNIWVESQAGKGSTFYFSIPK